MHISQICYPIITIPLQRGIENNTKGRQSVNHFAQDIKSQNCNEKICAIKSMAPLQHNDAAITDSII